MSISGLFYCGVTLENENIPSYHCNLLMWRDIRFYMKRVFAENYFQTYVNSVLCSTNYIICTQISVSFRNI